MTEVTLEAIVEKLLEKSAEGCCHDESWRYTYCQYHEGFHDGSDVVLELLTYVDWRTVLQVQHNGS